MEDVFTVCAVRASEVEGGAVRAGRVDVDVWDIVEGEFGVGDTGVGEVWPIESDVVADVVEDAGVVLGIRFLPKKNLGKD